MHHKNNIPFFSQQISTNKQSNEILCTIHNSTNEVKNVYIDLAGFDGYGSFSCGSGRICIRAGERFSFTSAMLGKEYKSHGVALGLKRITAFSSSNERDFVGIDVNSDIFEQEYSITTRGIEKLPQPTRIPRLNYSYQR